MLIVSRISQCNRFIKLLICLLLFTVIFVFITKLKKKTEDLLFVLDSLLFVEIVFFFYMNYSS